MNLPGDIGSFRSSGGGVGGGGGEEFESYGSANSIQEPQALLIDSSFGGGYVDPFHGSPPPPGRACADTIMGAPPVSAATNFSTVGSVRSSPIGGGVRRTKKRSRASRLATTTILTTDASNFRQMVQEFTGIPGTPLSMLSSFTRPRFDPGIASSSPSHHSTVAYLLGPPFGREKIPGTTIPLLSPFPSTGTSTNITTINTTLLPNPTPYASNPHGATSTMPPTTAPPTTVDTISPLGYAANSSSCGLPMGNPTFNSPSMWSASAAPAQMRNFPATECDGLITSDSLRCAGGGDDLLDMINGWN